MTCLIHPLPASGAGTAHDHDLHGPDAAEIEYASWLPDPGALEVASWVAHMRATTAPRTVADRGRHSPLPVTSDRETA